MPDGSFTTDQVLPINDVAHRFGIKASALRYYDEIGLLRPSLRRSGRRYYGLGDLRRLALIQLLQETAQLSLAEIAEILDKSARDQEVRSILERRISILQSQISSTQSAVRYLEHRLESPHDNPVDECCEVLGELDERLRAAGVKGADQPVTRSR